MQTIKLTIKTGVDVFGQDSQQDNIISLIRIDSVNHLRGFITYVGNNFRSESKMQQNEPLIVKKLVHKNTEDMFTFNGMINKDSLVVNYNEDGTLTDDSLVDFKEIIKKGLSEALSINIEDIE
jgi:hypothetical protein